jgi:class 3 adenylate cyclase/tetratricopeptide (TPR) repeat protein
MEGTIMQCPKCQFENREEVKFCEECGAKFELECPACKANIPLGRKFCGECGYDIRKSTEAAALKENKHDTQISESPPEETIPTHIPAEGERKHVTVLFSDLTGYTTMSEKLDPEEVKEITSRIFGGVSKIVANYDGFIEKYAGDAVLAIFGVPKAHEDDPIRAVRVAREIHELVDVMSPEVENRIGQPISMHTGINTGLVVTGEVDLERGTHGVAGDTINLASRLSSLAKAGEVLVDSDTYRQAEGHFAFESLGPTMVKGKADPVQVHKVLSQKEKPSTIHRLSGLRADLIGRKVELAELSEAVENLLKGKGRIFSICGDAGTGKSRLVEEFKATLDLEQIQWVEGHAYAYSQNIPYFPLIDLYNRVFQIEEGDPPENVREKIESGIEHLVGKKESVVPYVGDLYSLSYPEIDDVSPDSWSSRLQEASQAIFAALAKRAPTIFFLEDLHWADPSFVELLRRTCLEMRQSAIVLCVYRPTFSLFTSHQVSGIVKNYQDIRLQDLSLSDAQDMLESLLKTESIPSDLKRLVQSKAEGNPFYLEEMVNTLIESEALIQNNDTWQLTRPINESDISASIHALISNRIDLLETFTKRILQKASVIGRAFLFEILIKITQLEDRIEQRLNMLERLDLIRTRSFQPHLEYMFKHALTQEVVYNGILKKERQEIHERIGLVIETIFKGRLSEFYETLAYHFSHSNNVRKAIDYLMMSGEKNLRRYALDESHQFYKDAYKILIDKKSITNDEQRLLIDLLIKWSFVFFWRADHAGLKAVLEAHRDLVDSLEDRETRGMYYACLGFALGQTGSSRESYEYLLKASELCQEVKNEKFSAYCFGWLTQACEELGLLDDAIVFGKKGQAIVSQLAWDPLLFNETHVWMAVAYYYRGECGELEKIANVFIEKGNKNSEPRLISLGYLFMGMMFLAAGDYSKSIEEVEKAISQSKDPIVFYTGKMLLGLAYLSSGRFQEAEDQLNEYWILTQHLVSWVRKTQSEFFLNAALAARGNLSRRIKNLHRLQAHFLENGQKFSFVLGEYILGHIYFEMIQDKAPKDFKIIAKNIGFLIKTIPFAAKKAERHYQTAIQAAKEIGAKGVLGQSYLDLGILCKIKQRNDEAKQYISNAIKIFGECKAYVFLKQAAHELESLS